MRHLRIAWLSAALTAATVSALAQTPLQVRGLPEGAPLTVTAAATEHLLQVDLRFEPEWHAYSRDVGGGMPVRVALSDASDLAAAGALALPEDPRGELRGAVRLTLPLERVGDGRSLAGTLDLQVCDALECLAPMSLTLSGEVAPTSVLLVVATAGERAERIAGWLAQRGFDVTTTTYAEVTREACDARDVVLADSDLFQKHGVGRELMHAFPRTESPIVAVGFIGTELVEAHGLAMTSGYI